MGLRIRLEIAEETIKPTHRGSPLFESLAEIAERAHPPPRLLRGAQRAGADARAAAGLRAELRGERAEDAHQRARVLRRQLRLAERGGEPRLRREILRAPGGRGVADPGAEDAGVRAVRRPQPR